MSEQKHTPEPWWDESGCAHAKAPNWTPGVHSCIHPITNGNGTEEDSARACACVNACQGISTEALEAGVIGDLAVAYQSLVAVSPDLLDLWTDEIREQAQNALAKMKGQA